MFAYQATGHGALAWAWALAGLALTVGLAAWGVSAALALAGLLREQAFRHAQSEAVRRAGLHMQRCASWFAEEPAAEAAVAELGRVMLEEGYVEITGARDAWRKAMADAAAPEGEG